MEPAQRQLAQDEEYSKRPAVVGAELPFPVRVPPVERLPDGSYTRPIVRNYAFGKTDLVSGPADPRAFCDELVVEFESPETGAVWTVQYDVATPEGLKKELTSSTPSVTFHGIVIIVPRWDLAEIMRAVMDDMMDLYAAPEPEEQRQD